MLNNLSIVYPLRELIYLRDLLRELVVRNMKQRYQRSVLGYAWTLLSPLFLFLVFQFVFQSVLGIEVPRFGPVVFCGILVYSWFSGSIAQSTGAITGSRHLIIRPRFPASLLPLVTVTTHLLYFLFAFSAFILFLILFGEGVPLSILALPIVILVQFILTLSLSYIVASANVFLRDTQHIVGLLLQFLLFLSPIFYEVDNVPESYQGLYNLNPMVHLLNAYRSLCFKGTLPDSGPLVLLGIGSLVLLYFGLRIFLRMRYRFVEEL